MGNYLIGYARCAQLEQKQKYAAWRAAEIRKAVCGERKSIPDSVPWNEAKLANHKVSLCFIFPFCMVLEVS